MYKREILDKIAGALGLDAEVFAKGLSSETEEDLNIPEGRFLTREQEETLLDNHGKKRYDAGSEAAREMQLKDMSKLLGFEESIKDPEKLLNKYKENILEQAKIEPNKKVTQLEESLETLRQTIANKDSAFNELQSKLDNIQRRSQLLKGIPQLSETVGLNNDEVLDLFLKSHEIKEDGVYKDGVLLQDDLAKSLDYESVISSFVKDRGWDHKDTDPITGRPKPPRTGKKLSYDDFEAELKEKGYHPGSQEAYALLETYAKDNPEILN